MLSSLVRNWRKNRSIDLIWLTSPISSSSSSSDVTSSVPCYTPTHKQADIESRYVLGQLISHESTLCSPPPQSESIKPLKRTTSDQSPLPSGIHALFSLLGKSGCEVSTHDLLLHPQLLGTTYSYSTTESCLSVWSHRAGRQGLVQHLHIWMLWEVVQSTQVTNQFFQLLQKLPKKTQTGEIQSC